MVNRLRGEAYAGRGHGRLRYELLVRAKQRIEACLSDGHYCEVIALCESVIGDRLESRLSYLTGDNVGFKTLGHLLLKLREAETDSQLRSLLEDLDIWRGRRNRALHELVKIEDGVPHTSWDDRIEALRQDAENGFELLRRLYHRVADLNPRHTDRVF
jgi:hypothetical protein